MAVVKRWGGGVVVVLGAEKGSSLKASLRYSWSELGFHLACSPKQGACSTGSKNHLIFIQLD